MADYNIPNELMLKRFWVFDPPPELYKQIQFADLARLAVIQLNAQHAALKAQEEALEEVREIFSQYIKAG